ncbi:MAG: recombinase family protein [Bacillota bacterium]
MKNHKRTLAIAQERENNRALAIVRVSTIEQAHEERFSIPHQRAHINEECRHRGLDLVHYCEFVQSGAKVLSDSSKERAEILRYIKEYDIRVVIVHELDRLARSMLDTLLFVDELNKLGVTFISIHDGFDTSTPQGQLQMHILAAFAEYFRKQLASKVMGGMLERAKEGKHLGRRPFGYGFGEAGYVAIPEEARIVNMIFNMYLDQNMGLRAIADHLNGMGIKTLRGLSWSHQTTKDILENEVYTGTFTWGDIRVENNHPAIISRETWEKAQLRRRRKRELGGRSQSSFFLLSGLLRCGVCGESVLVGRYARKGKYQYKYYTCNNYASRGLTTCPSKYVRADELESMVMEAIKKVVLGGDVELTHGLIPSNVEILKEELALRERELDRLKGALVRAAEAYERGDYDLDFFSQRKESITRQREDVENSIKNLKQRINGQLSQGEMERRLRERQSNARAVMEENDPVKLKARLQVLIDRIEVRAPDDISIYYRG